ncbi:VOC family protein [Actinocorallia sp. API 0066]|uniref:VOC family protein n=1 Tax=Actinocorallia sp. API 0066 TaxID=2896846 RepID=UPI001E517D64|nr:VOC family protein [Actinocorallia sp. API 0066]MCD0453431.1 VOC family protein [Actinocorallia sp. API 0066]
MSSNPSIYPVVPYRDVSGAITFLCDAFGFTPHLVVEDTSGGVQHAELALGDGGLIMPIAAVDPAPMWLIVHVADLDAHYARALSAGARVLHEPRDSGYGGRDYTALDPAGHHWTISTYNPYNLLTGARPAGRRAAQGPAPGRGLGGALGGLVLGLVPGGYLG